jgi:DNA recombination protein RmuC
MEIAIIALLAVAIGAAGAALVLARRGSNSSPMGEAAERLSRAQAELMGRLGQMADGQVTALKLIGEQLQAQERAVTKMVDERLSEVTRRVGENLQKTSDRSAETMVQLHERLATIDAAQKNITELSAGVVSLQDILSNKQARGAIGQTQMEDLVRDMLPSSTFDFQVTLSNGKRADCVIRLPNPPGLIAVDSKYPHEAFMRLSSAQDERDQKAAEQAFRSDVIKHIRDIADKYIIPGETADSAIMFVPAESVFAELHDKFPMVVEEGFRRRVFIVSPTTLMATLNTIRTILKDARMREQAHVIQTEIQKMMEDVARLDKRVGQLATHFDQTQRDIKDVLTSTGKIIKRGVTIENIQLEPAVQDDSALPVTAPDEAPRPGRLQ